MASCEHDPARITTIRRHAGLVLADAERSVANPADLDDVRKRHAGVEAMWQEVRSAVARLDGEALEG